MTENQTAMSEERLAEIERMPKWTMAEERQLIAAVRRSNVDNRLGSAMTHCPRPLCPHPLIHGIGCIAHGEPPTVLAATQAASLSRERATRRASVPWTEEHWRFVEARAGKMSGREIARELTWAFGIPRTWKAVKHQFERRCVSKPEVRSALRVPIRKRALVALGPGSRWSAPEIEALEDGEVTILMRGRSRWAIVSRAKRMGIPIRSGDGMMSMREVAQRYRVGSRIVWQWISRGLLPARMSGRVWRVEPEVAERVVPILREFAQVSHGRRGWWASPDVRDAIASAIADARQLDRLVDDLVRPDLVRSEE